MILLVDFINEQGGRAFSDNLEKISYNVSKIPLLKEGIAEQSKKQKDTFSLITIAGRWVVVYLANSQTEGDIAMYFLDFRFEIDEEEYSKAFSQNTTQAIASLQTQYDTVYTPQMDTVELAYATPFSSGLIKEWEKDGCVNFAIGLARLTGWLLHIDAWISIKDPEENLPEKDRVPLRVFVGDNMRSIFDVRGIQDIQEFTENIIKPLAILKAKAPSGSVSTRVYSEQQLFDMSNITKPNETKIQKAIASIRANKIFLDSIPKREAPLYPAHIASKFTYGFCSPFAEALHDLKKLPITAMVADEYEPQFELSRLGYIHSFVLHSNGDGEDSWGTQPVENIAKRFGVVKYHLDPAEHAIAVNNHRSGSTELYQSSYDEAIEVIKKYSVE